MLYSYLIKNFIQQTMIFFSYAAGGNPHFRRHSLQIYQ